RPRSPKRCTRASACASKPSPSSCEPAAMSARGGSVDESGNRLQSAIFCDDREVRASDVERSLGGASRRPAEPNVAVLALDPADEAEDVARVALLSSRDRPVDSVVSLATSAYVDVGSLLGPRARDDRATALGVPLVPGGDV